MTPTRVILRTDVADLGRKGDVVHVAPGFARNHLVPKGLAMKASPGAAAQAASMRRSRQAKDDRDRESAQEMAARLGSTAIRVPAKAGPDGRLFGSVTTADLVVAVEAASGVQLDRRRVNLDEAIKNLGVHEVVVKLHPEVDARLTVEVVVQG